MLYDPLDPSTLESPYALYSKLLDKTPVFWHEKMHSWVVTRYSDCLSVLRNHQLYARDRRRAGEAIPQFRQSLQTLDPPAQTPLRRLMVAAFKRQDLKNIGKRAEAHIVALMEESAKQESFDWMAQVSAPFSLRLTADLLGVPEPDLGEYAVISEGIALRMDAGLAPENIAVGDAAREKLNTLGETWFQLAPDPASLLRQIEAGASETDIPVHYVRNSAAMMFNASYGTIYATAGNIAGLMISRPGILEQFEDDDLLTTGVDELVRFDGPAQGTSRVALRDTEIAGTNIPAGAVVLTLLAAANRDPRVFDRPGELILDRAPNRHLGYGWGPHSCLGSMFGQVALEAMIRGMRAMPKRLRAAAPPTRRRTATVRSYETLPVRFATI